ncbi:MAG: prephenate dehydratase domain-containing protein [Planctomycetia bacterium]|nr:prephenate dehydratase domain-containing protein [Planctomycetia bacterium]
MEPSEYRAKIDQVDEQIVALFAQRMAFANAVAKYKQEHGVPVIDMKREREKLHDVLNASPEDVKEYVPLLYSLMLELSRSYQYRLLGVGTELTRKIESAIDNTPKLFPSNVTVACQGVEGANSQIAADKLIVGAKIMYFTSFEGVFNAIEKGFCRYGVIPLENSLAGSVNQVYDLMQRHEFNIVRSLRLKVDHNLLVKPGVKLSEVREIYSHQHALSQCANFLATLSNIKIIPCENTAIAAQNVANSDRRDIAALASRSCIKLYGLECLKASVQDKDNNYTRFICISKDLEIYPGANRTSLMASISHEPGSLYKLLSRLYALGVNLIKLESRPLPDRDFEFMFYLDLDAPVYSPRFIQLMGELKGVCETFTYLGSYTEVI